MLITVPAETKVAETRVALTPHGARELVAEGHDVWVQAGAGAGSAMTDAEYEAAGARLVGLEDAWSGELVLKVKEPTPAEYPLLRDTTLFTFLHLAANEPLARALIDAGTLGISYDTVQLEDGSLPLLAPMSAVAGRMAPIVGAYHLLSSEGGRGVLLAGAPGAPAGDVVVIGAGVAGSFAVEEALGLGARVTVLDVSQPRLDALAAQYGDALTTVFSTPDAVAEAVAHADLVIGAVLVPGRPAPKVVTRAMVEAMKPGSVLVDIAIDQGGCFEDSHPTTHADPVYQVAGSQFYCVANMPGAVGNTATAALTTVTLPYVLELSHGVGPAIAANPALARGVNVAERTLRHPAVAQALPGLPALLPA
ncbi:alanine dehydrogenase [Demequina sp.]|uniref:alanine dehydrogenase n=1 Tax=Demequina sp. TaxID=2050685 RepID=UPI003D0C4034